jgi:hypothetical protein
MPDLSVVIPCWNAAGSIGGAIRSVLDEPGLALECIVVDDASTDGTADLVASIASADPRVILIRRPVNAGVSSARNAALERFRGDWLAFLDADDRFLPGGLAAMRRAAAPPSGATPSDLAGPAGASGPDTPLAVVAQQVWSNGRRTWIGPLYDIPDIREPGRKSIATAPGLLYHASPHAKLFHRSLVDGLRFEGRVLGDQPWVIRALLRAGYRIQVIDDVVYEWIRTAPRGSGGSITTTTRASVARGIEAAGIAGQAHASVTAEAALALGNPAAAARVSAAYAERLLRSDLAQHLARALDRRDPEIGALFGAIERFIANLPPGTLASSTALARDIVLPPLSRWPRVVVSARPAFWSLAAMALGAEPDLVEHAGSAATREALRRALASPTGTARSAAIAVLMSLRIVAAPRQLPRAIAAVRRRI